MLYADHHKAAKDLERRISETEAHPRSQGLGQDKASRPSKPLPRPTRAQSSSSSRHRDVYRRDLAPPPLDTAPAVINDGSSRPDYSPRTQPQSSSSMSSSQQNFEESFMVLNGSKQADPQDSFTVFFRAIEGMLDKFSQPVAFATAPLVASPPSPDHLSLPKTSDQEGMACLHVTSKRS